MYELLSQLSVSAILLLFLSLFLVLFFEFINGFHDTANAVATVIYTQAMQPWHAVILAGFCNFLGVLTGGLAVAYAIVNLLPVDLLTSGDSRHLIAMIFAILLGAIVWNLGTWYFGLPASSSHTLIGAIIGVGLTHALMTKASLTQGLNWSKAIDVGLSLLFSPLCGFLVAGAMLMGIRYFIPHGNIHQTPYLRSGVKGKKHPPFWTRFLLIISAGSVSFAHGSNDGQKGVGLMMLTLLCLMPTYFLVNTQTEAYYWERAQYASQQLTTFANNNQTWINQQFPRDNLVNEEHCQVADIQLHAQNLQRTLVSNFDVAAMNNAQRWQLRRDLLCMSATVKKLMASPQTDSSQKQYLKQLHQDFVRPVEYAPLWVIIAIASALGLGTMVGWQRVVKTIGEGIGRSHMTYAQGVCAQLTTALSIAAANLFGLPVSTTQILSSAVAGTAVANRSGLQKSTILNIVLAWLFTFPIAMLLAGLFYFLITRIL
ncbi:MAG: inorganic phosphate transporter [Neisseriaceae bacterium]|nr:inorganic phosphate transporter [Neisseriaceae bacterium]